jgi:hypothetical protein
MEDLIFIIHKKNLKALGKEGLGKYVYWARTCI